MVPVHVAAVSIGLALATAILLLRKGTALHRRVGWAYVIALAVTSIGSFGITEVRDGKLSIFHIASVIVLLSIIAGVAARRSGVV